MSSVPVLGGTSWVRAEREDPGAYDGVDKHGWDLVVGRGRMADRRAAELELLVLLP